MVDRQEELSKLKSFIGRVDTDLTMILQHLQWDRKCLLEDKSMVGCKHNKDHRVPDSVMEVHEQQCLLTNHGYTKDDVMLPSPLDPDANTIVKLNKFDITNIINMAAYADPLFKKGVSSTQGTESALEPLTLGRLQEKYTADERRAIYDAVVTAAPFCHDLSDLALPSDSAEARGSSKQKSRVEILAELRDMKRRRTKYRVAANTRNYSHVLRDVIKTQMEVYSNVKVKEEIKQEVSHKKDENLSRFHNKYNSSKCPKNTPHRADSESNEIRHRREKSKGRYDNRESSSSRRKRNNDLVQYPEPGRRSYEARKHKEERYYYTDKSSSYDRRGREYEQYLDSGRRGFDGIKIKEEKVDEDDASSHKRRYAGEERDVTENGDNSKRKFKEEKDSGSRNRFDETYKSVDRHYRSDDTHHRSDERHHRSGDRHHRSDNRHRKDDRYYKSVDKSREHKRDKNRDERSKDSIKYKDGKGDRHRQHMYSSNNAGSDGT